MSLEERRTGAAALLRGVLPQRGRRRDGGPLPTELPFGVRSPKGRKRLSDGSDRSLQWMG